MTTSVRQASGSDVDALVVLNRFVQELHVARRPDYFKHVDERSVADWFRSMLWNSAVRAWIAESEGSPVGYALTVTRDRPENAFCSARRFCEIDHIAVSPAFRRRGIARALVERVLEDARLRAIPDVELTSWYFNADAHDAFRAPGFTQNRALLAKEFLTIGKTHVLGAYALAAFHNGKPPFCLSRGTLRRMNYSSHSIHLVKPMEALDLDRIFPWPDSKRKNAFKLMG